MSTQEKQAARKNKKKKVSEPRHVTRAVTHIWLTDTNAGKLAALDTLAPVYLALCQRNYIFTSNQEDLCVLKLSHVEQNCS